MKQKELPYIAPATPAKPSTGSPDLGEGRSIWIWGKEGRMVWIWEGEGFGFEGREKDLAEFCFIAHSTPAAAAVPATYPRKFLQHHDSFFTNFVPAAKITRHEIP